MTFEPRYPGFNVDQARRKLDQSYDADVINRMDQMREMAKENNIAFREQYTRYKNE